METNRRITANTLKKITQLFTSSLLHSLSFLPHSCCTRPVYNLIPTALTQFLTSSQLYSFSFIPHPCCTHSVFYLITAALTQYLT